MWEFLISLFGGLFYSGKYANEKKAAKQHDLQRTQWQSKFDEYTKKYCVKSSDELHCFTDFVMSGEHYQELCEMFCDYFVEVLGADWENKLDIPKPNMSDQDKTFWSKYKNNPRDRWHTRWVYDLLLAHNKRIHDVYRVATITHDYEWIQFQIKSLKTIEDELHKQGETDIKFVMLCDNLGSNVYRTKERVAGGSITILGLNTQPSFRLW